jgi:hypothetical protein
VSTRPANRGPFVRRTAIWIPAVVIALLALPMVTSRSFGHDWTLHLWLIRQQQLQIEATGHPGLFVSVEQLGVFYPIFAFVGSGIYSVGGYLAIVLGDRPILAYKLLYVSGLCLAYGGMTWLSLQRGLRGWRSQIPGLVFVTGAYFVTQLFGIGDLGEFMALASIPFLIAALCAILTSRSTRTRDLLALVLAAFVFSGSNNITLLWGSVFLMLLGLLVLVAFGPTWPRPLPWRRIASAIGAAAIGAGLNAWYLLPDIRYGLDTVIARRNRGVLPLTFLESPGLLLNPLRTSDPGHNALALDIRLTLPWLFVAWGLATAFATWKGKDVPTKRWFLGLFALGAAYFAFAVAKSPWRLLPHPFYNIQFTRRLHAYLLLATALLVMVALEWQQTARDRVKRATATALALIAVFTVGTATWQVWRVESQYHVVGNGAVPTGKTFNDVVVASRTTAPPSWYTRSEFRDGTAPLVPTNAKRVVTVPVTQVKDAKFAGVLEVPDGSAPFRTNISGGPSFVHMTGIRAVGRTNRGLVVAVRSDTAPPTGPIKVTIEQAHTKVFEFGAIVSVLSALACAGLVVRPLLMRMRRRTRSVR